MRLTYFFFSRRNFSTYDSHSVGDTTTRPISAAGFEMPDSRDMSDAVEKIITIGLVKYSHRTSLFA